MRGRRGTARTAPVGGHGDTRGGSVIDAIPDWVRSAARDAYAKREPGVAVADLVFDSVLDDPARPESEPRKLRFARAGTDVDVAVIADDGPTIQLRILSARHPGTPVHVRHRHGTVETATNDAGLATVSDVSHGPTSVLLTPPGRTPVRTAWVVL